MIHTQQQQQQPGNVLCHSTIVNCTLTLPIRARAREASQSTSGNSTCSSIWTQSGRGTHTSCRTAPRKLTWQRSQAASPVSSRHPAATHACQQPSTLPTTTAATQQCNGSPKWPCTRTQPCPAGISICAWGGAQPGTSSLQTRQPPDSGKPADSGGRRTLVPCNTSASLQCELQSCQVLVE